MIGERSTSPRTRGAMNKKKVSQEGNEKRIKDGFVPANDINNNPLHPPHSSVNKRIVTSQAKASPPTPPSSSPSLASRLSSSSLSKGNDRNRCRNSKKFPWRRTASRELPRNSAWSGENDQKRQRILSALHNSTTPTTGTGNNNNRRDPNHNGSLPPLKKPNQSQTASSESKSDGGKFPKNYPRQSSTSNSKPRRSSTAAQLHTQKLDAFLDNYEQKYGLEPLDRQVQVDLPKTWLPLISSLRTGPYRDITAEILRNFSILSKSEPASPPPPPTSASSPNGVSSSTFSSLRKSCVAAERIWGEGKSAKNWDTTRRVKNNTGNGKAVSPIPSSKKNHSFTNAIKDDTESANANMPCGTDRRNAQIGKFKTEQQQSDNKIGKRNATSNQNEISDSDPTEHQEGAKMSRNKTWIKSRTIEDAEVDEDDSESTTDMEATRAAAKPPKKQTLSRQFFAKSRNSIGVVKGVVSTPESYTSPRVRTNRSPASSALLTNSRIPIALYYFKHVEGEDRNGRSETRLPRRLPSKIPIPLPKTKSKAVMKKVESSTLPVPSSSSVLGSAQKICNDTKTKTGSNDRSDKKTQQVQQQPMDSDPDSAGTGKAEVVAIVPIPKKTNHNNVSFLQPLQPITSNKVASSPVMKTTAPPPNNLVPERGGGDEISSCLELIDGLSGHTSWVIKKVLEIPVSDRDAVDRFKKLKENPNVGDFFGAPYVKKEMLGTLFFNGGFMGNNTGGSNLAVV